MAGSGGPWGGGGGGGDDDRGGRDGGREGGRDDGRRGGRRPGEGPPIPEIDEIMRKGQEQLRVLMGGRGRGSNGGGGPRGPSMGRSFRARA